MAHPYHHALSSVKKWGGTVDDFMAVHAWFDQSKEITADFRHRALRHHAEGIFMAETIFGPTLTLSTGRIIPTRWVGEQHVKEDLGFIPRWDGCRPPQTASRCAKVVVFNATQRRGRQMKDTMIGVDLAKNIFQLHGASMTGLVKFRKKVRLR